MGPTSGGEPPTAAELLAGMTEGAVDDQLRAALDHALDLVARLDEDQVETPLTPDELATLDAVTGADDAPLGFRSLRERVETGVLTWDEVWAAPEQQGPEGVQLVFAVLARSAQDLPSMDELVAAADDLSDRSGDRPVTGLGAGRRDEPPPAGPVLGRP